MPSRCHRSHVEPHGPSVIGTRSASRCSNMRRMRSLEVMAMPRLWVLRGRRGTVGARRAVISRAGMAFPSAVGAALAAGAILMCIVAANGRPQSIALLDLGGESSRQVVVDREEG